MSLTDEEQRIEFEHHRKIQNEFFEKLEIKDNEINRLLEQLKESDKIIRNMEFNLLIKDERIEDDELKEYGMGWNGALDQIEERLKSSHNKQYAKKETKINNN